jgi:hypothetical protein
LDAAIALAPNERSLQELRQSVFEIILLDEGQDTGSDIDPETPNFTDFYIPEEQEIISPDFARELLSEAQRENPGLYRRSFAFTLGGSYGLTQPVYVENGLVLTGEVSSPEHPFSRIFAETEYFFNESERKFGVAARYRGAVHNDDNIDLLDHQFDMTLHIRGYFAETMENRLILGAKMGIGYLFLHEDSTQQDGRGDLEISSAFVAGVYFEDALLRYLFKNQALFKKLLVDLNFDFFFLSELSDVSMAQYSIGAGYQFTENWKLGIFNEVSNGTSNIQETNSWEAGMKLKYSY